MATWAGYTRVSRVGDRKETLGSHDDQRDRIRAFVGSRFEVEFLEPESDISGSVITRPVLDRALEGIEHGRYAGIVVADIDRLFRAGMVDALHVIERIEGVGGQVIACAQNFDATTPEGEHVRNMWLSQARLQWRRYADQFERSKVAAVKAGIWPFPTVPRGYACTRRKNGGDGKLHPAQARGRVLAGFEARAGGASWREVAAAMSVSPGTARKIIRNPAYLGRIEYKGIAANPNAHEPIVARDVWEAAQRPQPRAPRPESREPALLRSLVRCASCGATMTPDRYLRHGNRQRVYRCRGDRAAGRCPGTVSIAQPKLDAYVEAVALEHIAALSVSAQDRSVALDKAMSALAAAEAELESFQLATRVSAYGVERFAAATDARVEAVEQAAAKVAEAKAAVGPLPDASTLRELWPDLSVSERGHVLRGAIGCVFVRQGRGTAGDRARIVAPGFEPARNGRRRLELATIDWDADLPGEIRPART